MEKGNIHVILGRVPTFSSDVYAPIREYVRSLRGPTYCIDCTPIRNWDILDLRHMQKLTAQ